MRHPGSQRFRPARLATGVGAGSGTDAGGTRHAGAARRECRPPDARRSPAAVPGVLAAAARASPAGNCPRPPTHSTCWLASTPYSTMPNSTLRCSACRQPRPCIRRRWRSTLATAEPPMSWASCSFAADIWKRRDRRSSTVCRCCPVPETWQISASCRNGWDNRRSRRAAERASAATVHGPEQTPGDSVQSVHWVDPQTFSTCDPRRNRRRN